MKRALASSVVLAASVMSGVSASASASASKAIVGEEANVQAPKVALPRLLSLAKPDLADGDLVSMSRAFGSWILRCEWLLSANKRVCAVEQQIVDTNAGLVWKIAPAEDGKPLLLISAPVSLDIGKGMRLAFSGLEKTLGEQDWICTGSMCLASFSYEGFLQAAITNSPDVKFSFTVKSSDGSAEAIEFVGPMDGISRALHAAASDPFGREALAKATAKKPQRKAAAVKPDPVAIQPKPAKAKPATIARQEPKLPAGLF